MTEASNIAHGLLLRHVATPDGQLALPVDPAAIARVEGIDVPSVGGAYGRWDSAVALGRALEPDGAEFGWPGVFAYALLMPAEIMRVMFASDLDVPEMARGFGVPWCQVRRRLAMLGLEAYCG